MALFPALDTNTDFTTESALRLPLGAASPLWFAFASAASAGVAYWWMTRWTRPDNLEAFGDWFKPKTGATPSLPLAVAQPALKSPIETPATAPVEAALETIEKTAADAVVETVTQAAEPVVALADNVAEQAVETAAVVIDDLTRIVGIGPRLSQRLGDLGVRNFADLAAWNDEDLARFDKSLDLKGRAVRDAWVAQARRFAEA